MQEKNGWIFVILIVLSIWFWSDHNKLTEKIKTLRAEVYESDRQARLYSEALDEANSNIEDAQGYAWSSYYDMGYVLDNLETVEP